MTLLTYLPIVDVVLAFIVKILLIIVLVKFISLLNCIKQRDSTQKEK